MLSNERVAPIAASGNNVVVDAQLFFSFRSPYSYLALVRWRAVLRELTLKLDARPVYPLAIRQPDFFERNHPNWLRYTRLDVLRLAAFHGIAMGRPDPDPIIQDLATRSIAAEQPQIFRLVRMGQAAARQGAGFAFADAVMPLIWDGEGSWTAAGRLEQAVTAAGLDWTMLAAAAESEAQILDEEVAANQAALEAAGHWGVPTLVFAGEPFFGQDRIELALWRMRQAGLQRREAV
ncbi:2-hydroxychromene-2-carboxylate isomerase [Sphingomonas sp.]|uniref:2-hydroxychromene-2-carboxylate isomerase n=1 Tax=Sphingomonas sp. TaxID=28214 RepID=UPI003CC6B1DA